MLMMQIKSDLLTDFECLGGETRVTNSCTCTMKGA